MIAPQAIAAYVTKYAAGGWRLTRKAARKCATIAPAIAVTGALKTTGKPRDSNPSMDPAIADTGSAKAKAPTASTTAITNITDSRNDWTTATTMTAAPAISATASAPNRNTQALIIGVTFHGLAKEALRGTEWAFGR